MKNKRSKVILALLPFFLSVVFTGSVCGEEVSVSPYYSLKTDIIKKNFRKLKHYPLRFNEIFEKITADRYIGAEAKGYSQEKYSYFRGKLIENALYLVERESSTEKELKSSLRGSNITLYGIIKDGDEKIIEVLRIEKGWNVNIFDELPLPESKGENKNDFGDKKNLLKIPYKQGKKKYKVYVPF